MKEILITGGRGFIGSRLMKRLDADSYDLVDGLDVRNLEMTCEYVNGRQTVFHFAAVPDVNLAMASPIEVLGTNVMGTWNVAYACKEYGAKLYFASSASVYGNQPKHPTVESATLNPSELYGCSKVAGEYIIKGFHHNYGLGYNIMRFTTIYGEGTRSALATHIFLRQALRGEPITVHGSGNQTRTLTYIDDLIDAIVALYKSGKKNDVWNMTATEEISAMRMAEDIKGLTKSNSPIISIPQRVGQTFKEEISADKMKLHTGWEARVSWIEGLERMYGWFLKTNQIENKYEMPT